MFRLCHLFTELRPRHIVIELRFENSDSESLLGVEQLGLVVCAVCAVLYLLIRCPDGQQRFSKYTKSCP